MPTRNRPVPTEKILPKTIRSSSEHSGSQGVRIIVRELPPSAEVDIPGGHDAFWLGYRPTKEPGRMVFTVDDPVSPVHIAEHNPLFLIPGAPVQTAWHEAEGVVANFSFHPDFLRSIADSHKIDFRLLYLRSAQKIMLDDSLESLCRLLTNEVDEGCKCGPKFVEQVTRAFGIAIVRQLAARRVAGTRSGLDGRIERAIQFIEENFRGRISVADMARAASLSTFHFFTQVLVRYRGFTP
jgi:hypothetical protein